jgi:hypothetical protein
MALFWKTELYDLDASPGFISEVVLLLEIPDPPLVPSFEAT